MLTMDSACLSLVVHITSKPLQHRIKDMVRIDFFSKRENLFHYYRIGEYGCNRCGLLPGIDCFPEGSWGYEYTPHGHDTCHYTIRVRGD